MVGHEREAANETVLTDCLRGFLQLIVFSLMSAIMSRSLFFVFAVFSTKLELLYVYFFVSTSTNFCINSIVNNVN